MWDPDIEIYFAAVDKFSSIEPNYIEGNTGFSGPGGMIAERFTGPGYLLPQMV